MRTGLFALIGAFIGAFLTRRIQHEKWLWERRSEVFSQYLKTSYTCYQQGVVILKNNNDDSKALLFDVYMPLLTHARLVRLFLDESDRERFHNLARKQHDLHSAVDLGDKRFPLMDQDMDEIQHIFERALRGPGIARIWNLTARYEGDREKRRNPDA